MGIKWVTIYDFDTKTISNNFTFRTLVQWLSVRFLSKRNSVKRWYKPMDIYLEVQHPDFFFFFLELDMYFQDLGPETSTLHLSAYKHLEDLHVGLGLQSLGFSIKLPPRISFLNLHKLKFSFCLFL